MKGINSKKRYKLNSISNNNNSNNNTSYSRNTNFIKQ